MTKGDNEMSMNKFKNFTCPKLVNNGYSCNKN